jgi:hypothetical protein
MRLIKKRGGRVQTEHKVEMIKHGDMLLKRRNGN